MISVDYTPAPAARYDRMSDEVVAVVQALREARQLADVLLYGDDSGGGLAAFAILKMRDRGLGLPAAAVLASPWVDLTGAGDTEVTLARRPGLAAAVPGGERGRRLRAAGRAASARRPSTPTSGPASRRR